MQYWNKGSRFATPTLQKQKKSGFFSKKNALFLQNICEYRKYVVFLQCKNKTTKPYCNTVKQVDMKINDNEIQFDGQWYFVGFCDQGFETIEALKKSFE